ncbi:MULTISPECIES: MarR family winged helix-turn-helix transcriptional regulator [Ferrimonas]|uniref:MarR family winged helix-turn-helix transcriptional regulator n=1 Tax=Ferrimonas TaxID=44011 RepID=UPI00041DA16E|nr:MULTISPECIES: MarR family transcriptional regulator [Ferrimonas]USD35854.1 MarR family transcriptional regulator [Ferrimonas sp. SCSIO 43195]
MATGNDDLPQLNFDNQVCYPLYSAANAVVRAYRPALAELDITYLQYMVLMLLWEQRSLNVKSLGQRMHLDSGTLTPLLKRLEAKGLVVRRRSEQDERVRIISITEAGMALKQRAAAIPQQVGCKVELSPQQAQQLKSLCQQVLSNLAE